jgi:DNA-binding CsgD family transcriptional regulator
MKLELFNNEANKLWRSMSSGAPGHDLQVELDLYKRLLNFFQTGDYFYFIFNIKKLDFDLVSHEVEAVLGYKPGALTTPFFMDIMHPEDRSWFLSFETRTAQFLSQLPIDKLKKYKVRYDFRMKKHDGTYIRVLHQVAVVQHDDLGGIIRTLGVHTDITHLKPEGQPVMSYIGMEGEPSYFNIDVKNDFAESKNVLSRREKEVLILLIEGKLSKQISDILNISKQTVDTHRKNMLFKNNLRTTGELIGKAIKQGWV